MSEGMFDGTCEGTNLVNKFPPFTSISVVDNIYAALWAGIVQDLEALVDEFIMLDEWDYRSFLKIAESRNIVVLHRSAFSMFPNNEKGQVPLAGYGSTRGRHKEQLQAYRRIVRIIFNVAKDIWLEPQIPLPSRNPLVDLKRSVGGLYSLYYMWQNQIAGDRNKVSIRYSPEDQMRARVVGENFLSMEDQIRDGALVKNCYKYLVTALSKRNAFSYSYVVDEPKLEFFHWQLMHLKNCSMRRTLTAINTSSRFYENVPALESMCKSLIEILKEYSHVASIVPSKSLFFRDMLPLRVIENAISVDEKTLKPRMKLPFDYLHIGSEIAKAMSKNVSLIEKPFLTMDALLQTDHAPLKIQGIGYKTAKTSKRKYEYRKKEYEKHKALFNKRCEEQHVPNLKIARTRKYRDMMKPAWLFITKQFPKIFHGTGATSSENTEHIGELLSVPKRVIIVPDPEPTDFSVPSDTATLQLSTSLSEPAVPCVASRGSSTSVVTATRTSARLKKKPNHLSPSSQCDKSSRQRSTAIKKRPGSKSAVSATVDAKTNNNASVALKRKKPGDQPEPSTSSLNLRFGPLPQTSMFASNPENSLMELEALPELLDDVPLVTLESSGDEG